MNQIFIKQLLYLCLFMSSCYLIAPQVIAQEVLSLSLVQQNDKKTRSDLKIPDKALVFEIENKIISNLGKILSNRLRIDLENSFQWDIELYEVQLLSAEYHSEMMVTHKDRILFPSHNVRFYQGHLSGDPASSVSLTVTDQTFHLMVNEPGSTYYIEPLKALYDNSPEGQFIMYNSSEIDQNHNTICHHDEKNKMKDRLKKQVDHSMTCVEIDMAIALDYSYVKQNFLDAQSAINQSLNVLHMVAVDFQDQFNTDIHFRVSEHVVSNCLTCDPWTSSSDVVLLLDDFSAWAQDGGFNQDHDLGQLWTSRDLHKDLNHSYVGYSHKGSVCSDQSYHILEDLQINDWKRRVLCSHEIGHNLNCSHDPHGSNTIMSPTLVDANTWSENSKLNINQFIDQASCLTPCIDQSCETIKNISIIDFSNTSLVLDWDPVSNGSYQTVLKNLSTDSIVLDTMTNTTELEVDQYFPPCQEFELEIKNLCSNGMASSSKKSLFHTSNDQQIEILHISTAECIPGEVSQYRLDIEIEHRSLLGTPFYVDINDISYTQYFSSSPQTISIDHLISLTPQISSIDIYSNHNGLKSCVSTSTFQSPNQFCDLLITENFNQCVLPSDWDVTSTNLSYFSYPYDWGIGDEMRPILNYAKEDNSPSDLTIDGSCMAYFDDDVFSSINYTGVIELYSPAYDISQYENNTISIDYIFHSFDDAKNGNASYFSIEAWDGHEWISLLYDDENLCPWSDVWDAQCVTQFSSHIDTLRNQNFQIRFIYSDGNSGDWTGMVALDNFILEGSNPVYIGCTDPSATNYNSEALIDDESCYSCHNGVMDGLEIGIDCGGPDCEGCIYPCDTPLMEIHEVEEYKTYENADTILIDAMINLTGINIYPGQVAIMNPGFEVTDGITIELSISPCDEE